MTERISVTLDGDGYSATFTNDGLWLRAKGRSYDQRDEREYEKCLHIPTDELDDFWRTLARIRSRGAGLALWPSLVDDRIGG